MREEHADLFAERISQLGGEPDFSPDTLTTRSHAEYIPGESLIEMIKEDPRCRTDRDRELSRVDPYIGTSDPTTRGCRERARGRGRTRRRAADLIQQIGDRGRGV